MRLFKKLKAYNKKEAEGAIFGFGVIRAMDYDQGKYGHLILFSLNVSYKLFLTKVFIPL